MRNADGRRIGDDGLRGERGADQGGNRRGIPGLDRAQGEVFRVIGIVGR